MYKKNYKILIMVLIVILMMVFMVSMSSGRYAIAFDKVIKILWGNIIQTRGDWSDIEQTVVMMVRLPRAVLAMVVGAGLAVSGVAMQALFSNPLVSPHVLGVSYGAGFGAALGILVSENTFTIEIMAMSFGLVAIFLTYMISYTKKGMQLYMLVLSGVIVGALFQAFISLIKYVADPEEKLPTIVYWLMGSLSGTSLDDLRIAVPLITIGIISIILISWKLNILSLSEEEAISMGVSLGFLRAIVIISTTIISAVSVSFCGIIGFVGLVIPHLSRMIIGSEHGKLVPVSIFIGGIYLLIIDTLSRTLIAAQIPISILTAVVGAPFFAYLLRRTGR